MSWAFCTTFQTLPLLLAGAEFIGLMLISVILFVAE